MAQTNNKYATDFLTYDIAVWPAQLAEVFFQPPLVSPEKPRAAFRISCSI